MHNSKKSINFAETNRTMSRVNYPIKLSVLIEQAQKALKQYGDRYVLISDDEEGNGFHECYYAFNDAKEFADSGLIPCDMKGEDCVILG